MIKKFNSWVAINLQDQGAYIINQNITIHYYIIYIYIYIKSRFDFFSVFSELINSFATNSFIVERHKWKRPVKILDCCVQVTANIHTFN